MISENAKNIINSIPSIVRVIAVTKKRDVENINELIKLGIKEIAENYLSEAEKKFPKIHEDIVKHFIGPIQSNKVEGIVENFDFIQSVDRLKIANLIDKYSKRKGVVMPILIQINISGEETKSGIEKDEIENFLIEMDNLENIDVQGLMCIGTSGNIEEFKEMKELFDFLNKKGHNLKILSMGMSEDYVEAISQGSNMIRIGRKFFEE